MSVVETLCCTCYEASMTLFLYARAKGIVGVFKQLAD